MIGPAPASSYAWPPSTCASRCLFPAVRSPQSPEAGASLAHVRLQLGVGIPPEVGHITVRLDRPRALVQRLREAPALQPPEPVERVPKPQRRRTVEELRRFRATAT